MKVWVLVESDYDWSQVLAVFGDEVEAQKALQYSKRHCYVELEEYEVLEDLLTYQHVQALEIDENRTIRVRAEEERQVREALRDQQIQRGEIRDQTLRNVRPAPHRMTDEQLSRAYNADRFGAEYALLGDPPASGEGTGGSAPP